MLLSTTKTAMTHSHTRRPVMALKKGKTESNKKKEAEEEKKPEEKRLTELSARYTVVLQHFTF